ncbi:hypothetical protein E2C01_054278 [Portunus trituberculatus]|uniref:Uncharacterized protein n=1 Tax=Portunus trituberculatus TaxID=210409 RepID=A0A5B7GRK1_PORTR|nr:hypothetical protein [Portunus trituberculatus]
MQPLVSAVATHWPGIAKLGRSSLALAREFKLFTGRLLLRLARHSGEFGSHD